MLTFFTTAKAFRGHDGIIQRNALKSWKLLDRDVEVIVFGEDEGVAEACAELGLVHHPQVKQHASGRNRLDYMFQRASQVARHDYLCYCNCDIVLVEDFRRGFELARAWSKEFLFVARRWDVDVTEPIHFADAGWSERLRGLARTRGSRRDEFWIDLFVFKRGMYLDMPPLIVGHCYWDNWMIWKALVDSVQVLDGTSFVTLVHQNHGYSAASGRIRGKSNDALSMVNLNTIGGLGRVRDIKSSTHRLGSGGRIYPNVFRYAHDYTRGWRPGIEEFVVYKVWLPAWHAFLDVTRPIRKMLGLRSKPLGERRES
jgi:hypothetical protein